MFVIDAWKDHKFELDAICNMDETPIFFDMPSNRTINFKGSKTVSIKTAEGEKTHFTLILSCLADGTKLKPAIIFKRKTIPKEKLNKGVIVFTQEKAWWLNDVWFKRPGALLNKKALIVWDMFHAHIVDVVKPKLGRRMYQSVIPGGCTSVLQPLDVCLNKPFKSNMRIKWNDWMINGTKEGWGHSKANHTNYSWAEIPTEMVIGSFLKCGISNSLDSTEDDKLFNDAVGTGGSRQDSSLVLRNH
ncbi:POGK-like protein [Mya arenaria]|uniref:POGK-like protein n=1 Tax=Mya arenaria TaxID=6604 RepID=A0ABY7DRT4_MYAAR|nr:POGK-like protein [Mya arenaria]